MKRANWRLLRNAVWLTPTEFTFRDDRIESSGCIFYGGDGHAAPTSAVYQILLMLRNAYEDIGD